MPNVDHVELITSKTKTTIFLFVITTFVFRTGAAFACHQSGAQPSVAHNWNQNSAAGNPSAAQRDLVSIDDLIQKQDSSEKARVAIAAAESIVIIESVSKEGRQFDNFGQKYRGAGFVIREGNGCYVVTARHVVNDFKSEVVDEKPTIKPVWTSPTRADVIMQIGFAQSRSTTKIEGQVIFSGPSPVHGNGDFALIRLKEKASVPPVHISSVPDADLVDAEFVTVGAPGKMQIGQGFKLYAELGCKGLAESSQEKGQNGGFPLSCKSSPGDSGGIPVAKVKVTANGETKYVWVVPGIRIMGRKADTHHTAESRIYSFFRDCRASLQ